ncbi:MAG: NADH-quinone oxidoreductase subunit NuoH [Chloroflexi bacterium HGW-Chloroflexi-9]|nr:MAG: NADH-quinone oxidoreductase subunit NuoH [Chloroflexi bacterium HGW-Chloroflexi-9]
MNTDLFGLQVNVWADAALRLQLIVVFMTVVVMGLIWAERRILGRFQQRIGPQKTGPFGLLQSLADAVKLVGKEDLRPKNADPWTFELAPFLVFIPIFMGFVIVPFLVGWNIKVLELGLLYFVAISSVNIVGWVMAGWGSDNRYAMIGGLRAAAQSISYELPLVLSLLSVAMVAGTLNLDEIVRQQGSVPYIVWQPMAFAIFFIAALAELNRAPFDIPVGESEVVGGPFVEYSGIRWSMFMLAEYAGLLIMAVVGASVFLGGYAWPLGEELGLGWQVVLVGAKASLIIFAVFWIRASLPRLRIDQLMGYSWKILLPLVLVQILVNGLVLVYGWSEAILGVVGLAGVVALVSITGRAANRPRQIPARAAALKGEAA